MITNFLDELHEAAKASNPELLEKCLAWAERQRQDVFHKPSTLEQRIEAHANYTIGMVRLLEAIAVGDSWSALNQATKCDGLRHLIECYDTPNHAEASL